MPSGWSGISKRCTKYELKLSYYYENRYLQFSYAQGSMFLLKLFPLRCTRFKLTAVTGPLDPPEIQSHHSERNVKVRYTRMCEQESNRKEIFRTFRKHLSIEIV